MGASHPGMGRNGCKSSWSGCKCVQVMYGQMHVTDDLVQVNQELVPVGASHHGAGESHRTLLCKSSRIGCKWVQVIQEFVQVI
jgi:hypothetical protein